MSRECSLAVSADAKLPDEIVTWVCEKLKSSSVSDTRRLTGGTQTAAWELRVACADGPISVVVKLYRREDGRLAAREAQVLRAVSGLCDLIPRLIAVDVDGICASHPVVLMSRLPGVPAVRPPDPSHWTAQHASALAGIHDLSTARLSDLPVILDELEVPGNGLIASRWPEITAQPCVATHGDFWTGNTLWASGHLTGVIDWANGGRAPRGLDVSMCRLDLALQGGEDDPDRFLADYVRATRAELPDIAVWDLLAGMRAQAEGWLGSWVGGYQALGRPDLGRRLLQTRLDEWVERAATRVHQSAPPASD